MRKLKTLGLFALLLIMSIVVLHGATGAWVIDAYTLDRSVTPWLQTGVDSVHIYVYEDDGVTLLDSVYTDEWGYAMVTMDSAQDGESHIRFYVDTVENSATIYQQYWIRLATAGADSTLDTIPVSIRMFNNPGPSTSVISFTLIEGDGSPAASVVVGCYTNTPYKDVNNFHMMPSNSSNQYVQSVTSNANGLVEITVVDSTLNSLLIGNKWTPLFEVTTDMTLDNIVYSPK